MKLRFYDESDIQVANKPYHFDNKTYPFEFIADVPGDNPDVLGDYDNNYLADKLQRFCALGKGDKLDCESSCFYIYFTTKTAGLAFLKKLNAYLSQKSRLLREAESF